MRNLFWVIAGLLFAIITHVSYALFVPKGQFHQAIAAHASIATPNRFAILDPVEQVRLFPFASPSDLVGACRFDVSTGQVRITIGVPEGYWSFAVYTLSGKQVYALNDRQAGTQRFNVTLARAAGLLEQVTDQGSSDEPVGEDAGWQVRLSETAGLAILWMPQGDPWRRAEAERVLRASRCDLREETP